MTPEFRRTLSIQGVDDDYVGPDDPRDNLRGPIRKPSPKKKDPKPLRSRPHVIPASVKQQVFDRAGDVCEWCEVPGGRLDCHHVIRRSQGGKDRPENLRAVHRLCHGQIHDGPLAAKRRGFLA